MKNEKYYHVGLTIRKNTMIIQAVRCIDFLDCELYDYMGERAITKQKLYQDRYNILDIMKKQRPAVYNRCRYAVVE